MIYESMFRRWYSSDLKGFLTVVINLTLSGVWRHLISFHKNLDVIIEGVPFST